MRQQGQRVRAVKEIDSKSIALCARRFEPCRCRIFFFPSPTPTLGYRLAAFLLTTRAQTGTVHAFASHDLFEHLCRRCGPWTDKYLSHNARWYGEGGRVQLWQQPCYELCEARIGTPRCITGHSSSSAQCHGSVLLSCTTLRLAVCVHVLCVRVCVHCTAEE